MSDTPDPAGREEPEAYVPSGLRRSTFSPAPADAPLPTWDDDALAAAMEEEVRTYTSPITLPVLPRPEPASRVQGAPPVDVSEAERPRPILREPQPQSWAEPIVAGDPASIPAPGPIGEPDPPVDDEQLLRELQGASTADAIQRLEQELQRRAGTGPTAVITPGPPFFDGASPEWPPAPGPDSREPEPPEWAATEPTRSAPEPPATVDEPERVILEPGSATLEPAMAVEPAPMIETEADAPLLPPPTELPDLAQRAELPPPPGYDDDGSTIPADESTSPEPPDVDAWEQLFTAPIPVPSVPDADASAPAPSLEPEEEQAENQHAANDSAANEHAENERTETPPAEDVDAENDDAVDEDDRAPTAGSVAPVPSVVGDTVSASAPEPEVAFSASRAQEPPTAPRAPEALVVEAAGLEPTPDAQRAGRAARLFWLWFAANASIVSVALGAVMLGMGMSLRQAIVATVIGIALSFVPLGFGTLAGRWSAQPTLVVSRAAFGLTGNALPAVLAVVVRVFWGGVLLWLLADSVGQILVGAHADAGLGANVWALVALALGLVVAALVATFGYGLLARVQLVLSVVAAVLIVASAAVTLPQAHLDVALTRQDGPWILVAGGAVLVFSFVGLAWAHSGADLARYQRPGDSGASSMLWATFGATIPPFLLVVWGAVLAASNPKLAAGFATHPLATLAELLPAWSAVPLLMAAAVGLISGSVLTLYSGGFAVQSILSRLPRTAGVLVAAILVLGAGVALVLLGADTRTVVRDLAVTLAVPVAAWVGIFAAEMMIRQRRFHSPSLLAPGGVYPTVRWVNLVGLVVISGIGYGFVVGGQDWLGWQGFGWRLIGVDESDPVATVDLGVLIALALGILLPLVSAVPTIRRQEAVVAITART